MPPKWKQVSKSVRETRESGNPLVVRGHATLNGANPSHLSIPFRTKDNVHCFKSPFQLGVLPENMRDDPQYSSDFPSDGVTERFRDGLRDGDLVLVATDGLWDNLYESEIMKCLHESLSSSLLDSQGENPSTTNLVSRLKQASQALCEKARAVALSETKVTPFAAEAEFAGENHFGGKLDDITVILAFVDLREVTLGESASVPQDVVGGEVPKAKEEEAVKE
ncbi:hypothetical protein M427DRAFT_46049 [Gonapodya prolifera JEL478]|uniref:Protein phosphatase n=1 Tax=Gonapodya prolifera (strain JEL478) TaxID=1344416 RepID=A0A139A829_GONPJ|nr:hypothetical protein M427DRAFT_46049 [Gonapodya prolifera JEL478]|eukprot:KXS12971.1 hypothetical protein M427DRAFT_46049 [Gonapodya prolifera JEL478]